MYGFYWATLAEYFGLISALSSCIGLHHIIQLSFNACVHARSIIAISLTMAHIVPLLILYCTAVAARRGGGSSLHHEI